MPGLRVVSGGTAKVLSFEKGARLLDVLRENGIGIPAPCGGRGFCGKCAVMVGGEVSDPDEAERRAGVRLACRVILRGDAEAVLPEDQVMEGIELGAALKDEGDIGEERETGKERETGEEREIGEEGKSGEVCDRRGEEYGAAVDIGTTTIALGLYDLKRGECLGRCGMVNPQVSVAADVMSRIDAAMSGKGELLKEQVTGAVAALVASAAAQAGIEAGGIRSMVITGNTTMLYFLTGRDPKELSHAPYAADWLFDESVELFGRKVYLPRCMHAFVGADITCAVLASGMCEEKGTVLLCDVGTNGEIALYNDGELWVTSTPAGPVFEGAGISCGCQSVRGAIDRVWAESGRLRIHTIGDEKAVGICGSGLIDVVAAALELGVIDETGLMECRSRVDGEGSLIVAGEGEGVCSEADNEKGVPSEVDEEESYFELAEGVRLTQGDIRGVQLAKAAIAAGIDTLLGMAGIGAGEVDSLLIAGGFGSRLNVGSAVAIGLFPQELGDRSKVLGNAAILGAAQILLHGRDREKARELATHAQHVDLGGNPEFNSHYIEHMNF